ncbi:hypothetical protein, partial [Paramuribaculum intestinale]|uniref:hypothetical protein n=1 Tax=Paramuribaculum intestinale TaxID=2094151 RepID=UPI00272AFA62
MINRISLLAAGLTVLFLPLQPRAAAAESFTPLTVGGITLDREDFNEVLGSDTRPDTTAMRLFEEYALRLAAAAAAVLQAITIALTFFCWIKSSTIA